MMITVQHILTGDAKATCFDYEIVIVRPFI
jgi:hypothetical protein